MDFKDEADEWMKSLGYSLHSTNAEHTSMSYWSNHPDGYHPIIRCWIDNHGKHCELIGGTHFKWFIQLRTGPIQFKHPSIQVMMNYIIHYERIAEDYPYKISYPYKP